MSLIPRQAVFSCMGLTERSQPEPARIIPGLRSGRGGLALAGAVAALVPRDDGPDDRSQQYEQS